MMKLGKESLLAIIESALFVLGAFFFLLVAMIPSNPIWALVVGILFGLAGAVLWSYPLFVRLAHRAHRKAKNLVGKGEDINELSKKLQGADNPENNTYELHRSDSYDDLTDDFSYNSFTDALKTNIAAETAPAESTTANEKPTKKPQPPKGQSLNNFAASFKSKKSEPTDQPQDK